MLHITPAPRRFETPPACTWITPSDLSGRVDRLDAIHFPQLESAAHIAHCVIHPRPEAIGAGALRIPVPTGWFPIRNPLFQNLLDAIMGPGPLDITTDFD